MKKLSHIVESLWSDIQDRNGMVKVRKEDDVNHLNRDEMYDYIYSHYEKLNTQALPLKGRTKENHTFFSIPIFINSIMVYNLSASYKDDKIYKIHLSASDLDCKDFYDEMNQEFTLSERPDHSLIISPKNMSQDVTNMFLLEVIDFICTHAKNPALKNKINESLWSDMQDRNGMVKIRKEGIGKVIEIDGVKYTLMRDFWNLGDEYEEENSDEWTCFAFNKPENSPTKIWGDTEEAGVFGIDKWDIGEYEYDVYVLRNYIDMDRDDYIQQLINEGNFEQMDGEEAEIQDILVKYTKKIFEDNHMSEFAHYVIYEILNTDYQGCEGIHLETDGFDYDEDGKPVLPCEADFEDSKVEDVHIISYPMLDDWYEPLRKELIDAYTKLGWKHLDQYELDPDNNPNNTDSVAFAKLKD